MTTSHHRTPSGWADLPVDGRIQLATAITDRIDELIGDSVTWSKRLAPVQNGREYLARYRCIQWAQDLIETAEALGIGATEPGFGGPVEWKATISTAEAFLEFQRDQYFAHVAANFGEAVAAEAEAHLQQMASGPMEEFRHSLERSLGDEAPPAS